MSKFKVFNIILFATVCIAGTPTTVQADSYKENTNDSQTNENSLSDILTSLGGTDAADEYGNSEREFKSFQAGMKPKCEGLRNGAPCWKELANRPGCFLWDNNLNAQTLTWSGKCSNGVANGVGTLVREDYDLTYEQSGTPTNGSQNGDWNYLASNGDVEKGAYVDGKKHGYWTFHYADGSLEEGSFVQGKQHGDWISRNADGTELEGQFSNGKLLGFWAVRYPDGKVARVLWKKARLLKANNMVKWKFRYSGGPALEDQFSTGKLLGYSDVQHPDGSVTRVNAD